MNLEEILSSILGGPVVKVEVNFDVQFFILEDEAAIPASMDRWLEFMSSGQHVVASDHFKDSRVMTVFVGFTQPGGMFETMIFGGAFDQYSNRYETLAEARKGHIEAKALASSENN